MRTMTLAEARCGPEVKRDRVEARCGPEVKRDRVEAPDLEYQVQAYRDPLNNSV